MRLLLVASLLALASCAETQLTPVPFDQRVVLNGKNRNDFLSSCVASAPDTIKDKPARCECLVNHVETYFTQDEWTKAVALSTSGDTSKATYNYTLPKMRPINAACAARVK